MKASAEVMREALEAIASADGRLTPDGVVAAAKPKDHPLHAEFLWDDKRAGHQYRIEQARALIRRTMVILKEPATECFIRVPFAVHDPVITDGTQGFRMTSYLQQEPTTGRAAMLAEVVRAVAAIKRARDLGFVLGYGQECEALLRQAVALEAQLREAA